MKGKAFLLTKVGASPSCSDVLRILRDNPYKLKWEKHRLEMLNRRIKWTIKETNRIPFPTNCRILHPLLMSAAIESPLIFNLFMCNYLLSPQKEASNVGEKTQIFV